MEVSLDNSLPFVVKISLLPWRKLYQNIKGQFFLIICSGLDALLAHPSETMVLLSIAFLILTPILIFSLLMSTAVMCITVSIILFEGFLLTGSLFVAILGVTIFGSLAIIWLCVRNKNPDFSTVNFNI